MSFSLADGVSLAEGQRMVKQAETDIAMPVNVRGSFQGTALCGAAVATRSSCLLIIAALVVIYIVLGILYESLIHPITVLTTLPSAGVGAVLALLLFRMEFSIIALIGVFLLIGIVKKNADPDHRLRAGGRALARACRAARGGARGLPAALPPDPDDHAGGRPRRAAAGHRLRRRARSCASRWAWPSSAG